MAAQTTVLLPVRDWKPPRRIADLKVSGIAESVAASRAVVDAMRSLALDVEQEPARAGPRSGRPAAPRMTRSNSRSDVARG
jgi:hypothetical protein